MARLSSEVPPDDVKWFVMRSNGLDGEEILIVLDETFLEQALQNEPDHVMYTRSELTELQRLVLTPGKVRKIHMIKKKFTGTIVPSDSPLGERVEWDRLRERGWFKRAASWKNRRGR